MHDSIYRRKINALTGGDDLEPFLQQWLYFGLLNEFLGQYISPKDLVRVISTDAASTKVLSTSSVPEALQTWVEVTQSQSRDALPVYEHLADCLQLLWANLRALKPYVNEELILMLASLGELFSFAIEEAFKEIPKERKHPKTWLSIIDQEYWVNKMRMSRFCPIQIAATLNASSQIHAMHFIVHLDQPDTMGNHDLCSENACFAWENGKPRHLKSDCPCNLIEADQAVLSKILKDDYIPLLRIGAQASMAELELEIVSSEDYPKYLALSHVWTDGLGNRQENALPRCQFHSLRSLLINLRLSLNLDDHQELLLWCDTMCCPVGPADLKTLALTKMNRIYQEATCVLVLDRSLQYYPCSDLRLREIAFRIVTSAWSRRLWTLQEAVLAIQGARLWFQFRDKVISVQAIVDGILSGWRSSQATLKASAYDLMARTGDFFLLYSDPKVPNLNVIDFKLVTEIIQNRSVTVAADEALLIGNLLNLDAVKILKGQSSATRMRIVWSLMPKALHGIPTVIIFWIGPRLTIPGFRWAPATLLHSHPDNFPLNKIATRDSKCEINPDGLRLRTGGYSFTRPDRNGILKSVEDLIRSQKLESIYVRCEDCTWLNIMPRPIEGGESSLASEAFHSAISQSNMWLIDAPWRLLVGKSGGKTEDSTLIGLLVKEIGHKDGVKIVRSHYHVSIHRVKGTLLRILQEAHQASEEILGGSTARSLSLNENLTLSVDLEEVRAKMQTMLVEVEQLVDKFDRSLLDYITIGKPEGQGISELVKQVYHFVLGIYGCLSDKTTQEWCVD
ncbi:MAG: hypothetical protein L6R41_004329 [Letrouitia leprolyta]|nr:MAG: hypothetical protein L6R41_004329 [Letrouitia leprolyta]